MIRIGHGYDVHRFTPERSLILCGVEVTNEFGLAGHSDADVAVHALMDAILGALAMGDIGHLFPNTDPAFKDANSMMLLMDVVERMSAKGYNLGNLDITIIAEEPKLSPFIPEMRGNLAAVFNCDIDKVSIKATTEEGLGLAGMGIGAHANVILMMR